MGRILSIRLSAVTYNEEDVFRAWPGLCALAWPGQGEAAGGVWKPQARMFAAPIAPEPVHRGVLDLVQALGEEFRFGNWEKSVKEKMGDGMEALRRAAAKLDSALEDWQPREANVATDDIEDALDKLESTLT